MTMDANDLMDMILEKKARAEQRAYDSLKGKITDATTKMITNMSMEQEIELNDEDLSALIKITEELRDLDYKFRFIEVQDSNGETMKHKLLISINHL